MEMLKRKTMPHYPVDRADRRYRSVTFGRLLPSGGRAGYFVNVNTVLQRWHHFLEQKVKPQRTIQPDLYRRLYECRPNHACHHYQACPFCRWRAALRLHAQLSAVLATAPYVAVASFWPADQARHKLVSSIAIHDVKHHVWNAIHRRTRQTWPYDVTVHLPKPCGLAQDQIWQPVTSVLALASSRQQLDDNGLGIHFDHKGHGIAGLIRGISHVMTYSMPLTIDPVEYSTIVNCYRSRSGRLAYHGLDNARLARVDESLRFEPIELTRDIGNVLEEVFLGRHDLAYCSTI